MNDTRNTEKIKRTLLAFSNCIKVFRLYPAYNPIPLSALSQFQQQLSECLKEFGSLHFRFTKTDIFEGNSPVRASETEAEKLRNMSKEINARSISSIIFIEGVTKDELISLINLFIQEPEDIEAAGGAGAILNSQNVSHIRINEIPRDVGFSEQGESLVEEAAKKEENFLLDLLSSIFLKDELTEKELKLIEHLLSKPKDLRSVLNHIAGKGEGKSANINLLESALKNAYNIIENRFNGQLGKESLVMATLTLNPPVKQKLIISLLFSAVRNITAKKIIESISPDKIADTILEAHDNDLTRVERVVPALHNTDSPDEFKNEIIEHLKSGLLERGYSSEEAMLILGEKSEEEEIQEDSREPTFSSVTGYEDVNQAISIDELEETSADANLLEFLRFEARKFRAEEHIVRILLSLIEYAETDEVANEIENSVLNALPVVINESDFDIVNETIDFLKELKHRDDLPERSRNLASIMLKELSLKKYIYQSFEKTAQSSPESKAFKNAIKFLREAPRSECISTLIEILSTEEMLFRRKLLINLLTELGKENITYFLQRLENPSEKWYLIRNIVTILKGVGNPEALPKLKETFDYPDIRVKKEVISAIASIGGAEALDILVELYERADEDLKILILKNVGSTNCPEAIELLRPIVENRDFFFRDINYKLAAIESLAKLRTPEARETLIRLSKTRHLIFRRKASQIASAAKSMLSSLSSPVISEVAVDA